MSGDVRSKAIGLGSRLHFVSLNLRMKKVWTRQRSVSKTITLAQNGQMTSTTISAVMWVKLMFLLGHTIHSVRNETACNTCCDAKQFLMDSTQAMFQCLKRSGPTRPFFDGRERSVHLIVECDSDWAGELPGQKSASGGIIRNGACQIPSSWSRTQQTLAQSSCQGELAAIVKAVKESVGPICLVGVALEMVQDPCVHRLHSCLS